MMLQGRREYDMSQLPDDVSRVDQMERRALAVFCNKDATSVEKSVARAVLTEANLFKRGICSALDVELKYSQFWRVSVK
ncbi:hypothetical protein RGCCGE502_17445 [Rhizobium grahamii CCGE 502]|uniref:Uncharacterized protein n=1 Tax=Rhizobium grahamii CCGE 502 TaxID=990285 RepID=S3ICS2_9HYPH|nr:hypothetical protein RGCCGE502_17445 [Rhizobium grahamii CCGE 502]